jgi:hypothetical protein
MLNRFSCSSSIDFSSDLSLPVCQSRWCARMRRDSDIRMSIKEMNCVCADDVRVFVTSARDNTGRRSSSHKNLLEERNQIVTLVTFRASLCEVRTANFAYFCRFRSLLLDERRRYRERERCVCFVLMLL